MDSTETVRDKPINWEELLASEQVRRRVVHGGKERDDKQGFTRELQALQQAAVLAHPPNPDPLSKLEDWEEDELDKKWGLDPPPSDQPPRSSLTPGLLSQGWHLVAPVQVLGWMVAQNVLNDTRGTATDLGVKHLGLRSGFRSANRARYFAKLCRQNRDLATLTLQRNIIWALADLGVIPETVTDAGLPVQTMLVGQHQEADCCVLISGDHLRLWHRRGAHWSQQPSFLERLPENFSMVVEGDDAVTINGTCNGERRFPMTVNQLQLHTFPGTPSTFPVKAWARRTGLNPASVIPRCSSDVHELVATRPAV